MRMADRNIQEADIHVVERVIGEGIGKEIVSYSDFIKLHNGAVLDGNSYEYLCSHLTKSIDLWVRSHDLLDPLKSKLNASRVIPLDDGSLMIYEPGWLVVIFCVFAFWLFPFVALVYGDRILPTEYSYCMLASMIIGSGTILRIKLKRNFYVTIYQRYLENLKIYQQKTVEILYLAYRLYKYHLDKLPTNSVEVFSEAYSSDLEPYY